MPNSHFGKETSHFRRYMIVATWWHDQVKSKKTNLMLGWECIWFTVFLCMFILHRVVFRAALVQISQHGSSGVRLTDHPAGEKANQPLSHSPSKRKIKKATTPITSHRRFLESFHLNMTKLVFSQKTGDKYTCHFHCLKGHQKPKPFFPCSSPCFWLLKPRRLKLTCCKR